MALAEYRTKAWLGKQYSSDLSGVKDDCIMYSGSRLLLA